MEADIVLGGVVFGSITLSTILWTLVVLVSGLRYAYWWQQKEYRFDRMRPFLRSVEGKRAMQAELFGLRLGLLFITLVVWFGLLVLSSVLSHPGDLTSVYSVFLTVVQIVVIVMWISELLGAISLLRKHQLVRPVLTAKGALLLLMGIGLPLLYVFGTYLLVLYIFASSYDWIQVIDIMGRFEWLTTFYIPTFAVVAFFGFIAYGLYLVLVEVLLPGWFMICVCVLYPLTYIAKQRSIKKARDKVDSMDDLTIIGITGSFGKTTTKDFLSTILEQKFNVCKTPENINTELGVAHIILKDLHEEHQILVAEMGAYKMGEIKAICDIAPPSIGLVTAISEQHLEMFGSIEGTMKAKYELIEVLSSSVSSNGGLAVFNADDKRCREMASWYGGSKVFYTTKGKMQVDGNKSVVMGINIQAFADRVEFDLSVSQLGEWDTSQSTHTSQSRLAGSLQHVVMPVLGAHNVSNFLAAASVALKLGVSLEEISQAALRIQPQKKTMSPKPGINGAYIVDDSYNANPDGFIAALEYIELYKASDPGRSRVLVVSSGMIELGTSELEGYQKVGKVLSRVADEVVVTKPGVIQQFELDKRLVQKEETDPLLLAEYLQGVLDDTVIVLLEGRLPDVIGEGIIQRSSNVVLDE